MGTCCNFSSFWCILLTKSRPYSGLPAKRWLHEPLDDNVNPDDIIVDEGNSTRKATDEELREHHGLFRCTSEDCANEYIDGKHIEVQRDAEKEEHVEQPIPEIPVTATDSPTPTAWAITGSRQRVGSGDVPKETGRAVTSIEARQLHRYRHSHGRRHKF